MSGDHEAHLVTDTEVSSFSTSLSIALVEEDAAPFSISLVGDEAILHTGRGKGRGGEGRDAFHSLHTSWPTHSSAKVKK